MKQDTSDISCGAGWLARVALAGGSVLALALAACGAPRMNQPAALDLTSVLKLKPQTAQVSTLPGLPAQLGVIAFADAMHGWVGGQGVLLATSDGGRSWQTAYLGGAAVESFSILSAKQGFAATNKGLLATHDGSSWRFVSHVPLTSVQFFTPQAGVVLRPVGSLSPAGPNAATPNGLRILQTADGGRTWQEVPGPPVLAACFFNPQRGTAALRSSSGLTLSYTANGGRTWSSAASVSGAYGAGITCTPDGGAWLVADGGVGMSQASYSVLRSGDFGRRWAPVLARPTAGGGPAPGNPSGVTAGPGLSPGPLASTDKEHAVMLGTCWACEKGTVLLDSTSDGGRTWQLMSSDIPYAAPTGLAVSMPTPGRLWLLSAPLISPGVAVGSQSVVAVSTDDGQSWQRTHLFAPAMPYVVHFTSGRSGYGVGWPDGTRKVMVTHDGGISWQAVGELPHGLAPAASYDPLAVPRTGVLFLVAADEPYDQHQALYVSRDGGRIWRAVHLPSVGYGVSSVSFASGSVGCVTVSAPGGLRDYSTRDGGTTWQTASHQGMPAAVCAESLADPQLGMLAINLLKDLAPPTRGEKGTLPADILASADAGGDSLWISLLPRTSPTPRIYVLGPGGHTARVWTWPRTAPELAGMAPVNPNLAYIWSGDGHLLRTSDGGRSWRQVAAGP